MTLVLQGALPVGLVYLSKPLVDGLAAAMASGGSWQALRPLFGLLVLMGVLLLMIDVLQSGCGFLRAVQAELVRNRITRLIHEKSVVVDLAFYESSDYYDQLHRARNDSYERPLALLADIGQLVQHSVTLLGMSALLLPFGLWLPLALVVSALPGLLMAMRFNQQYHAWYQRTTADRRWANYYDWRITDGAAAPELRLFGLGAPFIATFRAVRERLLGEQIRLQRGQVWGQLISGVVGLSIIGLVMIVIIQQALNGRITLGQLLVLYQVFDRGQVLMRALLSSLGSIYAHSLFLSHLFTFLDLQPQVVDPQTPIPAPREPRYGLRFRQVSFRYPGSERVALQNFDLTIPAGQVVAIVGANGAGKSTLVKLLCRFYDPTDGAIEIDGIDVRNFAVDDLRRLL
jgi:ATP-binding cassette subfamily B protein